MQVGHTTTSFITNSIVLLGGGGQLVGAGDEVGQDLFVFVAESCSQRENGCREEGQRVSHGWRRWRRVNFAFLIVELLHGGCLLLLWLFLSSSANERFGLLLLSLKENDLAMFFTFYISFGKLFNLFRGE